MPDVVKTGARRSKSRKRRPNISRAIEAASDWLNLWGGTAVARDSRHTSSERRSNPSMCENAALAGSFRQAHHDAERALAPLARVLQTFAVKPTRESGLCG